jgi:hypothetical protein
VYHIPSPAALLLKKLGLVPSFSLYVYRHRSFYTMRADALDRSGTRLEQRFTAQGIKDDAASRAGADHLDGWAPLLMHSRFPESRFKRRGKRGRQLPRERQTA